ncbi:MAG: threonine dehydratase [Candidatus Sericytochromatia bacterium]|nr:MAG: threonine dehydratase [Candidatus Sericytochromatia bacterium]
MNINVSYNDILLARENIKNVINKTPLQFSQTFSDICGFPVYLKPENLQKTGSYKIRGAYNKICSLSQEQKEKGVMTASAGNHAQGLSYAAKMAGIKATVFMPKNAPIAKIEATKGYGANVIITGNNFDETTEEALNWQKTNGSLFISPFDDDYIIAGQGTIGLEILEEINDIENIIIPIGGGGLISGISIAVKTINDKIKIIGVQAEGSPALYKSYKEGRLINVSFSQTIADGINIKKPTERTFNIIKKYVDDIVTVDDEEISEAMIYLIERCKLVVEPSGAVGIASIINKKINKLSGKTCVVISGGNVDIKMIDSIVKKGLLKAGRYLKFTTMISDIPGSLYTLLGIIYHLNASVININHNRLKSNIKIGYTEVEILLETINQEHNNQILEVLKEKGYNLVL